MAKELTIEERLFNLAQLQIISSKIDEIQILKGELPMEVSDLEDEIAGLQKRVERVGGTIDEMKEEISNHTANIKEAEALIERYEKQLDNVKNNREYDALTKEIDLQKLEIQLSEKKIVESKTALESKEETLEEVKTRVASKEEQLNNKKEELEKIITKTEKEEKKLAKKVDGHRELVDARLLKAFDKIRMTYRNGLAVVPIERDACGGCFNKIPPQIQLEIGLRKKIIACEHCGRVLIDDEIKAKAEDKVG